MSVPLIAQALRVAEQRELSIYHAMALIALAEFTNATDGTARPSLPTLAKRARQSPRQAFKSVHALEGAGLLRIGRRGRVLEYRLQLGGCMSGSAGGAEPLHHVQEPSLHGVQESDLEPAGPLHHVQENSCTTCNSNLAPRASEPLNVPLSEPLSGLRPAQQPDIRSELFTEGIALYRGLSGVAETSARKVIGAFLRDAGDDAAQVMAALRNAADIRPADPYPFIRQSLQSLGLTRHERIRRAGNLPSFLTGDCPPEWLQ